MRDFYLYGITEQAFLDDSPTVDQFCTVCNAFCDGETCECGLPLCLEHGPCAGCDTPHGLKPSGFLGNARATAPR